MFKFVRALLQRFLPVLLTSAARERLYGCIGAFVGLLCTEWAARHLLIGFNPWFVAPMGASAVLLFAVPTAPMAQPWPIIGGNLVSGLIGVACAHWLGVHGMAAAFAAAFAIGAMFQLRCLHPPGGAVAVSAVLGGTEVQQMGVAYVFGPVMVNSLLLLALALLFNNLLRRRYPHRPVEHANLHRTGDPPPSERLGFTPADLDAVLAMRGEVLDISKDDLAAILVEAELLAYRRRFGDVCCHDIMSRDVVLVSVDTPSAEAWGRLARHKVKALPVVTGERTLVGIVSLHDFFIGHDNQPRPEPLSAKQMALPVAGLMSERVVVARPEQPIVELVKAFSDGGLHHLPVVDEQRRVVGMITQSDLVAALFSAGLRRPHAA